MKPRPGDGPADWIGAVIAFIAIILALFLLSLLPACSKAASVAVRPTPTPAATPYPEPPAPMPDPEASKPTARLVGLFADPPAPTDLSPAGYGLIIEFEVGGLSGYNPRPEAPDAIVSGITWGIGYDGHTNSAARILEDWKRLRSEDVARLALIHKYYGRSAQAHLNEVRDILVAWAIANDVFLKIDVAREFASCRRAYKDFDSLRPNAQAALISLTFNRGTSTSGPTRTEMRAIVDLVPKRDYEGIAGQLRAMKRVWRGTAIQRGMERRRDAEAVLVLTP